MAKTKTLDQLRAEKEQAEAQLLQEQHKLQRLEQRKKHYEKVLDFSSLARQPKAS